MFKKGKSYELRLLAEKGHLRSPAVSFNIDVPDHPANECIDQDTKNVYQVGQVRSCSLTFTLLFTSIQEKNICFPRVVNFEHGLTDLTPKLH